MDSDQAGALQDIHGDSPQRLTTPNASLPLPTHQPNLEGTNASWCKIELNIDDPKMVTKLIDQATAPPMKTMTLQMKTVVSPKTHTHEIVAIAAVVHNSVNVDGATDESNSNVSRFAAVRALGSSAGPQFPARLPHDLKATLQAKNLGVVQASWDH